MNPKRKLPSSPVLTPPRVDINVENEYGFPLFLLRKLWVPSTSTKKTASAAMEESPLDGMMK